MTYISPSLRRFVIERANGCCEYCLRGMKTSKLPFAIDHMISTKHGGETVEDNLCLSCFYGNSFKGSDIASADPNTGLATFLYRPRLQTWHEHFAINKTRIDPLTAEGRVTVFILQMNNENRTYERELMIAFGSYPCVMT